MKKKQFYKMLTEIHNGVSEMACGCMGCDYTAIRVEKSDTYISKQDPKRPILNEKDRRKYGKYYYTHTKSDKPLDYIGNIIRRYVKVS